MYFEYEFFEAIGIIILAGVIIGVLLLCLFYLSDFFNEYNQEIADLKRRDQLAEERDREIITQAKRHTIKCTNDYAKSLEEKKDKKDIDFEVDFNVKLSGSIVKTEVVYAE
jgi:hypothetical protein